ncbi:hypothetical protein AA0114_g1683 [Alternaria tenuissima]|jgi:hypothetical protein|uniref:Uncharacterized protein n=1 Tax=Alternaria tenuissima TaxID=119927 RepID=A0A4Q4MSQ0_9PLEO|nr:hypothetical protein AA0114_g1683 [Alternaria tenuissima]
MPPLFKPSSLASTESWHPPVYLQHLSEAILLFALFATVLRSFLVARREGRMTSSGVGQNDLAITQEKKLPIHQRKDSYQEELNNPSKKMESFDDKVEEKSTSVRRDDNYNRLPSLDQEPNQYLQSLQQETLRPILSPIYPWTSPPQRLPGPYDAPYFPVPLPTVRSEESSGIKEQSPIIKTEPVPDDVPEELETVSYTRRVSTPSIPDHESLLEGAVTVSSKGWRRTQWTVTAG